MLSQRQPQAKLQTFGVHAQHWLTYRTWLDA
jgi:hypothetical protein